ncbi:Rne/Rng family ribonuclease [Maricaulaceae bacterium MS644]
MSRKMLIDASHPEETRVVVVENNRVEEFDFESASKKPIRGNIYLARVTRVEPSLQAAFVEYGGNKHGFLAFNEIHPDYYQIPHADREELRKQEAEIVADYPDEGGADSDEEKDTIPDEDDLIDEAAKKRRNFMRKYKIQEVIKRRQVLLVQVAKEERGNKGAALTTYLSLAGRYSVLMPNTARGGGISRKIANVSDRKRLKSAVGELDVPGGMGLIIRTAGQDRTKAEIKRDYEYLIRLWEDIRTTTLESVAPSLIYEEGNLTKRVIRDLYDKDIEEVLVEGEEAYKEARAFMRMLMPSHAKKVQHYKEDTPLFLRHQVESQLESIHSPVAQLKSGGYIVINPTEALVSIDVNSGKSTKERNIEQTALRTNLEAADEAARQMRLRDLAGLLVIDFIDMDENKNVRQVEKCMKDALQRDRARLQVGRISQFGLMEMSRQRRRTSLVEGSSDICPQCGGAGHVRSIESSALVALRTLEEEGVRGRTAKARLACPAEVALYLLNEKRDALALIEQRYEMRVIIAAEDGMIRPDCRLERLESRKEAARAEADAAAEAPAITATALEASRPESSRHEPSRRAPTRAAPAVQEADDEIEDEFEDDGETLEAAPKRREDRSERRAQDESEDDGANGKKRRRRGRRGGRNRRRRDENGSENGSLDAEANAALDGTQSGSGDSGGDVLQVVNPTGGDDFSGGEAPEKRERPGRRRRRSSEDEPEKTASGAEGDTAAPAPAEAGASEDGEKKPRRRRRRRAEPADNTPASGEAEAPVIGESPAAQPGETQAEATQAEAAPESEAAPKPKRRTRRKASPSNDADAPVVDESPAALGAEAVEDKPKRRTRKKAEPKIDASADADTAPVAKAKPKPKPKPKPKLKPEPDPEPETASESPRPAETPAPAKPSGESGDTDGDTGSDTGGGDDGKSAKRGWWQRSSKFLGLG